MTQRCVQIFERLKEHNLKLKPSKFSFAVKTVTFLGHVISGKGISIDPRSIESVRKFQTPQSSTDVGSFHGICNYNRKFTKNFAEIAKPLTCLMGKKSDFVWTEDAQQAFETLRAKLINAPILVHFNPNAEHKLRTDASSYAIGAVLYQKHADLSPTGTVLYHSKTLSPTQRSYSPTERSYL